MSDILVFVNESSFCCVIADETDWTLETFRRKMQAQVDDLLCFPFKFTRLVNGKRLIVLNKKQLSNWNSASRNLTSLQFILFKKKPRPKNPPSLLSPAHLKMRQERGFWLATDQKTQDLAPADIVWFTLIGWSEAKPKQPYSAAKARKIKIYSHSEIANSSGMAKVYREFWKAKGEELCRKQCAEQL